jgi:hypothetical protein
MIEGTIVFDGIAIGELKANLIGASPQLSAKAAFIDTKTRKTHGWTLAENMPWSKETLAALDALCVCMERDMSALHMVGQADGQGAITATKLPMTGLTEHLTDDDGVQV